MHGVSRWLLPCASLAHLFYLVRIRRVKGSSDEYSLDGYSECWRDRRRVTESASPSALGALQPGGDLHSLGPVTDQTVQRPLKVRRCHKIVDCDDQAGVALFCDQPMAPIDDEHETWACRLGHQLVTTISGDKQL